MSDTKNLSSDAKAFIAQAQNDARRALRVLRETRTLSASGTLFFVARIPGEDKLVNLAHTGPWGEDAEGFNVSVVGFDETVYLGRPFGEGRFTKLFEAHDGIQALAHVHTPYLGAYAQAQSVIPLTYVPNRRFRFSSQLPVHIDRNYPEVDFILDAVARDQDVPAIVEGNGGATAWSWKGLIDLAQTILLLEEGAQFQVLSQAVGGPKQLGPGVLQQQWTLFGLLPKGATVRDDGSYTLAAAE